ncbi:hypothetical protein B0I35DRAFT_445638 [Stachybotrys elegans]|uniref:Uncharacterized protein n=1 Tax=Stachybotrys elegans TaxID=80388 RepID=A0A8K0S9Q4_9HYPO|nr:hypothetical protein B0I35DRAFT_445638 [Stachybotrys elegans]
MMSFAYPMERLVEAIMASKALSLDDLRRMDQQADKGILGDPRLYQILVAAAFQAGNRLLVRQMIHAAPPPPGVSILFAGVRAVKSTFGGISGYGHAALSGQDDNGCDLFVDLINAGWAVPHPDMAVWPIYSQSIQAGKALMNTLVQHNVAIDERPAICAISSQNLDMLDFALQIHTPTDEKTQFYLLLYAAQWPAPPERLKYLEILWNHGVHTLNWRLTEIKVAVRSPDEITWEKTALHVAVQADDAEMVEWLIQRGAKTFRDKYGKNPFEYAKLRGNKDVLAVFERYPDCQSTTFLSMTLASRQEAKYASGDKTSGRWASTALSSSIVFIIIYMHLLHLSLCPLSLRRWPGCGCESRPVAGDRNAIFVVPVKPSTYDWD